MCGQTSERLVQGEGKGGRLSKDLEEVASLGLISSHAQDREMPATWTTALHPPQVLENHLASLPSCLSWLEGGILELYGGCRPGRPGGSGTICIFLAGDWWESSE